VALIDLEDYPGRLRGGYWKMDGHWNEKGNAQVSEIIAQYIMNQGDLAKRLKKEGNTK
jgi:hypothetical protein